MKITKRDIKFFFFGVLATFIVDLIWNWNEHVEAFKEGWNAV